MPDYYYEKKGRKRDKNPIYITCVFYIYIYICVYIYNELLCMYRYRYVDT